MSDDLLDAVSEDKSLSPEEKETTIRFAKGDDRATVFTAEGSLMRRVLAHSESAVDYLVVHAGDGARRRVCLDEYAGEDISGVSATVPVGTLNMKSSSRKSSHHAPIISGRVLEGDAE